MNRKYISILLCLIMILQTFHPVFADALPSVDDYNLYDASGARISLITAGEKAKLEITLTDTGVKTGEMTNKDYIEVINVSGCFGTSPAVSKREILSSANENLKYKLTFDEVIYTGTGNNFGFKIRYRGLNVTSQQINLKISECNAAGSGGDTYTETGDDGTDVLKILPPTAEIVRGDIAPVRGGESFELEVTIKNRGSTAMLKPVVTVSASGSIALDENTSSFFISDIKAGAKAKIKLRFRAEENINVSSEEFNVNVKFNYNNGTGTIESGDESAVITVPMVADSDDESAPVVQVVRGDIAPAQADTAFTLPVTVNNYGNTDMKNTVLNITADDGLTVTDGNITHVLDVIPANGSKTVNIGLKTASSLEENYIALNCELKYNYTLKKENVAGSDSTKLVVPVVPNAQQNATPLISMTRSDIKQPVKAGREFGFNITVKNVGTTDIVNAALELEGSDEIMITDGTSAFDFAGLKAGESKTFKIKAKTSSEISSASQSINAELRYNYRSGKNYENATNSIKILVPLEPTKKTDDLKNATPNIIIDNFNYGGASIANGQTFDLYVSFENMGDIPVENIVMTMEPESRLAITSATNTYYYDKLAPGQKNSCTVGLYALPTAESGSAKIDITFKYEYVDNKQRSEATNTQSVSVPLYKPDLMELDPPSMDTPGVVGEEYPISITYVNKGRGEISNMRAEIIGDIEAIQSVQNLGNIDAGKSGNINFVVIPYNVGDNDFSVKITYEDANMQEKERIFELCVNAEEQYIDEFEDMDMPEEVEEKPKDFKWPIIIGGGIAAAAVIFILRKRKHKKDMLKINWEDQP